MEFQHLENVRCRKGERKDKSQILHHGIEGEVSRWQSASQPKTGKMSGPNRNVRILSTIEMSGVHVLSSLLLRRISPRVIWRRDSFLLAHRCFAAGLLPFLRDGLLLRWDFSI